MNELIDMHTHTTYSDGELSPMELVREAINSNIKTLAITDHDTVNGIKNIDYSNSLIVNSNINIIPGIELNAYVDNGTMHILGYGIDISNKDLIERLEYIKNNSFNKTLSIMEELKRIYNIKFTREDILTLLNSKERIGRPDLALLCIKYGYASSVKEAFDKYLVDAYNKVKKYNRPITYQECIDIIKKSGGIPVLAHPKSLKLSNEKFNLLIQEMISNGLEGIEVYHSTHSYEEMNFYKDVAIKNDIFITGGSDFHGKTVKPDIKLGTGINNNLSIKDLKVLTKIKR